MKRRQFLQIGVLAGLPVLHSGDAFSTSAQSTAVSKRQFALKTQTAKASIVGPDFPATDVWAINDTIGNKLDMPPLIDVKAGTTVKITLDNQTAFPHPMHLHGHHMKLLSIDGVAVSGQR